MNNLYSETLKEYERKEELIRLIKQLTDDDCKELLNAAKIIEAVPIEQGNQITELRKAGLTIEQIAEKFGVTL